jgi:hypothetical protein
MPDRRDRQLTAYTGNGENGIGLINVKAGPLSAATKRPQEPGLSLSPSRDHRRARKDGRFIRPDLGVIFAPP